MAEVQGDEAEVGSEGYAEEEEGVSSGTGYELADDHDIVAAAVEVMARSIVDHPDDVRVFEVPSDRGPRYRLTVHEDDIGRVIGKGGRTANALRQIARAAATRAGISVLLEIGD